MKKFLSIVGLVCLTFGVNAQSLETHIPLDAECVASINGSSLTPKVGLKNIQKSAAFLDFAKHTIFSGNKDFKIGSIGIDLEKDLYFFYHSDTIMSYYAYLYEIEKPKLFERYIDEKNALGEKVEANGFKILFYDGEADFLAWNDDFAMYIYIDHYFKRSHSQQDYMVHDLEMVLEEAIEEADEEVAEPVVSEETEEEYEARMKAIELEKEKEEAARIAKKRANLTLSISPYFSANGFESNILSQEGYVNGKDKTADIHFWLNSTSFGHRNLYSSRYYYSYRYSFYRTMRMFANQYFGEEISSNLYFKDQQIEWKTNLKYPKEIVKYFSQIYSTRLPKNYLKYIEETDVLGITSTSFSAQKVWESYPKMYAMVYGELFDERNRYDEEIQVLTDFISIMLDEKALGDIATGDAVVVLKDLRSVEVEYKTYEWNDAYTERNEVTKTKEEIFPEFLLMFGTRNGIFIEKLLNLACKNEVMYRQNQYYYTTGEDRDFPFKLYVLVKNDIAFVSTDLNEIQRIIEDKTKSGVDKKLESKLLKNQGYAKMNIKQFLSRFNPDLLGSKEARTLIYARENTEFVELFSNFNESVLKTELEMATPKTAKNSAIYLWDFVNELYAIENGN